MTKTRLEVLSWTGMRPSELMRVTPADLDLEERVVWVSQPAKDGEPHAVPLSASAIEAWQRFVDEDAWGAWSLASARKVLHRACAKAEVPAIRIYDLRHSVAGNLRRWADLADVQAQLGHASMRTTLRYAPTVTAKLVEASDAYERARLAAREALEASREAPDTAQRRSVG